MSGSKPNRKGGHWCSAPNCTNNSNTNKGISFFRFPKDEQRSKKWTVYSRREDLLKKDATYLYKNCFICSEHFEDVMFLNFLKNRLKPDAVPTLFNIPNAPKQITPKRKRPKERTSETCEVSKRAKLDVPVQVEEVNVNVSHNINPEVPVECTETTVSVGSQVDLTAHSPRKEKLRRKLKLLKGKNRYLQSKVDSFTSATRNNSDCQLASVTTDQFKSLCDSFLTKDLAQLVKIQVDLRDCSKNGMRYPENLKRMALTLYFLSPNAYQFMQNKLQLPSTRCLRRMTEKWQYSPGPNEFIFSHLKLKVSKLNEIDKYCVLSADEMSLKSFLFNTISDDEIVGLHNTGTVLLKPARYVLVFMVRSLCGNWKQPISYYFTNSGCSAVDLRQIVQDLIERLHNINIKICLFVTDMGSNFLQFARNEGVNHENPYFVVGNDRIFYMFDVPHLFKSLRNNMLKYDFMYDNKIASWQDIVQFYNKDKLQNLRQAKNLTDAHLYPNGFQKMKVKLAVQIFSHTVASSLLTYVSLGALRSSAVGTAEFLEKCNDVFDLLNSSSQVSNTFYARAWIGSEVQQKVLNDFLQMINSISIKDKENRDVTNSIKCFQGFAITVNSFLQLWSYLKTVIFICPHT